MNTEALLEAMEAVAPEDALIVVPEMATGAEPDGGAFLPADEVEESIAKG